MRTKRYSIDFLTFGFFFTLGRRFSDFPFDKEFSMFSFEGLLEVDLKIFYVLKNLEYFLPCF